MVRIINNLITERDLRDRLYYVIKVTGMEPFVYLRDAINYCKNYEIQRP